MNKLRLNLDINKNINYIIVVYSFCIPISRAGISIFSALLFILWFFKRNIKDDLKVIFKNKLILIFVIFVSYSGISLLWSSTLDEGFNYLGRYWFYLPILVIATSLDKKYLGYTITAFLFGMLISEILSYSIFFELINFKNVPSFDPTPFMNHLQYAVFITFTSLYLLNYLIFDDSNIKTKLLGIIFFITVTANLFVNGGRIGYIAFFITIFLVFLVNIKSKFKAILISILTVGIVFSLAYKISPTFKTRLNNSINELAEIKNGNFHTSFGQRLAMIYMSGEIAKDNLLFGVGIGDEMPVLQDYIKKEEYKEFYYLKERRHFHNIFVHILVQIGLVGLILLLLLFYYLYKINTHDKYFNNVKYIFVSVFLITCLTGNMFHQQFPMALFCLIIGVLLSLEIQKEKELRC